MNPFQEQLKERIQSLHNDVYYAYEIVGKDSVSYSPKEELAELHDLALKLLEDNVTLANKCKEHYEKMQELLNSSLGRGELRRVYGKVGDDVFSITPDGHDLRLEPDLPEELKK